MVGGGLLVLALGVGVRGFCIGEIVDNPRIKGFHKSLYKT